MTLYIFSVANRNEGWSVAVGDGGVCVVPRACDGVIQVVFCWDEFIAAVKGEVISVLVIKAYGGVDV